MNYDIETLSSWRDIMRHRARAFSHGAKALRLHANLAKRCDLADKSRDYEGHAKAAEARADAYAKRVDILRKRAARAAKRGEA